MLRDDLVWKFISRAQRQQISSLAVAASANPTFLTTGFIIPFVGMRSAILIKRYTASFYEKTPISAQLEIVNPPLAMAVIPGTDSDGNLLAVGHWCQPAFVSHILGFASAPFGALVGNSGTSTPTVKDQWFDSDAIKTLTAGGAAPASIRMLGSVLVINGDAGGAHTISANETLLYEIWQPGSNETYG